MLVGVLMSLLVVLVSGAWSGLGRPSADALVRCRVAQEANLALESLARDLGGSLPEQAVGQKQSGRLVGRLVVDDSQLWLCFDGEPADGLPDWGLPDTVITYEVSDDNRLVRSNEQTQTAVALASNVQRWELDEQIDGLVILLTCSYRDLTRTYTVVAKDP